MIKDLLMPTLATAIIASTAAAQAQAIRIQCSPHRVEGTQCPQASGICPDTLLGIGGNYAIDLAGQSVTRYDAEWTLPQRVPVGRAGVGEITTEESDRYFGASVTTSFHLGDGGTPITYVISIFPIAGAASRLPALRSEGSCVRVSGVVTRHDDTR
jgi:hypothetical protein